MLKRALQLVFAVALTFTMLGADTPATRFDHLGHQLVCQCGCGQILLECNHVNCPVSGPMIDSLKQQLTTDLGDTAILNTFVAKYGPVVLAAPIRGGFDDVAWIVPIAIVVLGILLIFFILRIWKGRHAAMATGGTLPLPPSDLLRDRIRRETGEE